MKLFLTLSFLVFSLTAFAMEMEKPKGIGEVSQSLSNVDGTSPCADRNNDGISDCQQQLGKRPGSQNGLPSGTTSSGTTKK